MDPIANEPAEEREDDMSSITARFATRMCKWAASTQRETIPESEVPGGKCPQRSGLNDEVQRSPIVVTLDSPEQASDAPACFGGFRPGCFQGGLCITGGWGSSRRTTLDQVVSEALDRSESCIHYSTIPMSFYSSTCMIHIHIH